MKKTYFMFLLLTMYNNKAKFVYFEHKFMTSCHIQEYALNHGYISITLFVNNTSKVN